VNRASSLSAAGAAAEEDEEQDEAGAAAAASSSPNNSASSFPTDFSAQGQVAPGADRACSRASDEDDGGSARKKLRLSKEQSAFLEDSFKEHATLNPVSSRRPTDAEPE
jgi:homeobox-leucine zipper protein